MFGKIYNGGTRDNTFNAMYAAGSKDQALVTMAASKSGVDIRQVNIGANATAAVSAQDDISADATLNRIPNAIQAGGARPSRTPGGRSRSLGKGFQRPESRRMSCPTFQAETRKSPKRQRRS